MMDEETLAEIRARADCKSPTTLRRDIEWLLDTLTIVTIERDEAEMAATEFFNQLNAKNEKLERVASLHRRMVTGPHTESAHDWALQLAAILALTELSERVSPSLVHQQWPHE
jgi:predicted nucleic acid-binding protein